MDKQEYVAAVTSYAYKIPPNWNLIIITKANPTCFHVNQLG